MIGTLSSGTDYEAMREEARNSTKDTMVQANEVKPDALLLADVREAGQSVPLLAVELKSGKTGGNTQLLLQVKHKFHHSNVGCKLLIEKAMLWQNEFFFQSPVCFMK